jgi:hypothetical protein
LPESYIYFPMVINLEFLHWLALLPVLKDSSQMLCAINVAGNVPIANELKDNTGQFTTSSKYKKLQVILATLKIVDLEVL